MIVDSHCHLDYSELYSNIDDVIKRANKNQVEYFLTICTTLESFKRVKILTDKYKNIYGTFGIHPHETKKFTNIDNLHIYNLIKNEKKIIGVGETGLDYFYNYSDKIIQKKSFVEHINASAKLKIPVIVHSRNAEVDTYEILKSEIPLNNPKILIHCFTGSYNFAKKLLDIGCFISFSGIITFKNTSELEKTVLNIPNDRILVETDSPYLAPIPFRGKPNEPSYIKHTVEKISNIKNVSIDNIMKNTSNNFFKLFNLNRNEN